ncbi:MAG: type III pantothenate kinase [Phycisphaerae bacterium]
MPKRLPPMDELVVVDVGNTRLRMAVCDDDGLRDLVHASTLDPGSWRGAIERTWSHTTPGARRAIVVCSVRPAESLRLAALVCEICGVEPLFVGEDVPLPLELDVENPDEVGIDRVCSAAAAYERVGAACAVASFGTAITIDCVSRDGRFLGGAILPGMQLSCDALHQRAAQLPQIQAAAPEGPFGRSTRAAIINGVAYGAVGALREIVERYATELHEWPELLVTGGNGEMIAELADFVDAHVAELCLVGIGLAYRKAAAP